MATYKIINRGDVVKTCKSELAAIKEAEALGEDSSVVMHEVSGDYESHTQIWPTVGDTYTN